MRWSRSSRRLGAACAQFSVTSALSGSSVPHSSESESGWVARLPHQPLPRPHAPPALPTPARPTPARPPPTRPEPSACPRPHAASRAHRHPHPPPPSPLRPVWRSLPPQPHPCAPPSSLPPQPHPCTSCAPLRAGRCGTRRTSRQERRLGGGGAILRVRATPWPLHQGGQPHTRAAASALAAALAALADQPDTPPSFCFNTRRDDAAARGFPQGEGRGEG